MSWATTTPWPLFRNTCVKRDHPPWEQKKNRRRRIRSRRNGRRQNAVQDPQFVPCHFVSPYNSLCRDDSFIELTRLNLKDLRIDKTQPKRSLENLNNEEQEKEDRMQFKIRSLFLVTSFPPNFWTTIHYVGARSFIELTRTIACFFYLKTSHNVEAKLMY